MNSLNVDYVNALRKIIRVNRNSFYIQGGSNMTGTDLCANKSHCAAAVRS